MSLPRVIQTALDSARGSSWGTLVLVTVVSGVVAWQWYASTRGPEAPRPAGQRLGREAPPPECAREVWEACFSAASLGEVLQQYGRRREPTVLMVVVEPTGGDANLERWVWPHPTVRELLRGRPGAGAAPEPEGGADAGSAGAGSADAGGEGAGGAGACSAGAGSAGGSLKLLAVRLTDSTSVEAQVFMNLQRDRNPKLPLFFFLWGPPSIMCFSVRRPRGYEPHLDTIDCTTGLAQARQSRSIAHGTGRLNGPTRGLSGKACAR